MSKKEIQAAESRGFMQGVAYMIGLVGSEGFHVHPDDLFNEPGFTLDDLKDAGADKYDLRLIAKAYKSSLRKHRRI